MKIKERIYKLLNENHGEITDKRMMEEFGIETKTEWNILSGRRQTKTVNGEDMTPEQHAWLRGHSEGYTDAMKVLESY